MGTQASGRDFSQFVDLAKGSFWRTDLVVKLKPPSKGQVTQRLGSQVHPLNEEERTLFETPVKQKITYRLELTGTEVILKGLRALIMLPEGVQYKINDRLRAGYPKIPASTHFPLHLNKDFPTRFIVVK